MVSNRNLHDKLMLYTGGLNINPIDISKKLPRQSKNSYDQRRISDIKRIVIHTTDWDTSIKKLARYDITPFFLVKNKKTGKIDKIYNHISKNGVPAITYHEVIVKDNVYKTLDQKEIAWHVGNWNGGSLGLAMMYVATIKNSREHNAPPINMMKIMQSRAAEICLDLGLTPDKVVGHRELKGTGWFWAKGSKKLRKSCPGKKINMDLVRKKIALYMQVKLSLNSFYFGRIDGDFGPKSKLALIANQ